MKDLEIPAHAHCKVCGKAMPEDSPTCSPACATRRADTLRRRQMLNYIFWGTALFLVVVLYFSLR